MIILGRVEIGEGSIIQAGSVVCKSIPAMAVAGGHLAVPFTYRNKDHYDYLKDKKPFIDVDSTLIENMLIFKETMAKNKMLDRIVVWDL